MEIYLLRHGETQYNRERRYQGLRDIPLSPEGEESLCQAEVFPKAVYVSPLMRARQTAQRLFPEAEQLVLEGLQEMDLGDFEGRTADEMAQDQAYRAWVDGNCQGKIPGGESMEAFAARTCGAFAALVEEALDRGEKLLCIVAHGGTQMAVMERYARPHRPYFAWYAPNGSGYLLRTDQGLWNSGNGVEVVRKLSILSSGEDVWSWRS